MYFGPGKSKRDRSLVRQGTGPRSPPLRPNSSARLGFRVRVSDQSVQCAVGPVTSNRAQRSALARWCSGYDVGLAIERPRVRFPAGALPGSLGQLSLVSLRGRKIEYQLTGWG